MKIISLNIWGGSLQSDLLNFFEQHKNTDIFCLQEAYYRADARVSTDDSPVSLDILSQIELILPEHQSYFLPVVDGKYGIATLVHKSLLVCEHNQHLIYDNPSYIGRGPTHSRFLQHIRCSLNGVRVNILNVHGLWNGNGKTDSEDRIRQSKNIKDYAQTLAEEPIILCGDFNLRPDTESMGILNAGMRNLIAEHQVQSTRTNLYTKEERHADYVLISPSIEVHEFKVLSDEVSDHAPLWLDISTN